MGGRRETVKNTNAATVSRSCSAGSRAGDGSQHAMTDAQPLLLGHLPLCNCHALAMSPKLSIGMRVLLLSQKKTTEMGMPTTH